jgi:CzcA family heavy metal efflux pump
VSLLHRSHSRATAIFLLLAALVAAGVFAALRLPSAIFPAVTFPIVKVIADVGEEPAARMIPTVTRPLEQAVDRVPGIQRVLSTTSRGSTELSAEFAWGTDMEVALQRVQAEIERVRPDLPPGTRVEAEWMNTSIFPILGYALTSDSESQWRLWQLAEFTLKPALIRIPGVSRIEIQGGRRREFQVHLDAQALAGRHLTPAAVVEAIRRNNQVLSSGLVERNHELYLALVDGRAGSLAELGDLAVPVPGGVPARLAELGTLTTADAVSFIRTSADGREAVLVNIVQQPSANTVEIARGVRALLAAHPELVPAGVRWSQFYDQAGFISSSVGGVREAILIGVALAALVLLVFLRSWRLALVAVATIPVTVALVLLGLHALGQTANLMTLGGIAAALGLVVDDAIVVVENIHRHRETGRSDHPVLTGASELLPALVGSSLSTIVVFLPFAFLSGVVGAFFKPLALTMVLALGASFLLAAFVVPLATRAAERRARPPAPGADEATPGRRDAAWRLVGGHWLAALAMVALGATGWLLDRAIDTDFLPAMDEGSIILDYWTPAGTSLTDTHRMLLEAEKVIRALPDVESYSRRTGTQLGFFITEPNRGDYVIKLRPRGERRPVDEIIDDLRQGIARVEPAIVTDFGQLMEDDIGDLTGGVPQPIDVKVFGDDQALLERTARRIAAILGGVRGVEDVFDGITIAGPALHLETRSAELARRGLTTEDLQQAIEASLVGTVAGDLRLGERVYDVRVFADHGSDLEHLRILSADGKLVPLSDLATVTTGAPEAEIDRDNLKTYLGVTARLSNRSLGSAVAEIQRRLRDELALPAGMSLEYGGLYEQQQSSFKGLLAVLAAGLVLVAVVLLFEFGDWRAPLLAALIALGVLPGVFAALMLAGKTLNISSFVGAIMMVGIVGENAIFVIHEARLELAAGLPVREAWAVAARRRLRPVAMTILATACALAPLALALGEGAQLLQPLAIAVVGGFVLSGPLVLWVLPALYAWFDPKGRLGRGSDWHLRRAGPSPAAPPRVSE